MTDRGPASAPVITAACAVFCLVLVYLALQVRAGTDPAIGAGHQAQAQAPRQIVVRRVIIRRVLKGSDPSTSAQQSPGASASPSAAPVAAAPAPAPAPTPMVTRAS
jgi:hypothetical protein